MCYFSFFLKQFSLLNCIKFVGFLDCNFYFNSSFIFSMTLIVGIYQTFYSVPTSLTQSSKHTSIIISLKDLISSQFQTFCCRLHNFPIIFLNYFFNLRKRTSNIESIPTSSWENAAVIATIYCDSDILLLKGFS